MPNPSTHPWQPRKPLKDSYSKHASAFLIIKMNRAEQRIKAEIEREQVYRWPKEKIKEVYG